MTILRGVFALGLLALQVWLAFWKWGPALGRHDWLEAGAWLLLAIYVDQPSQTQFWNRGD